MSTSNNTKQKVNKIILRKPTGTKVSQGWAAEVIATDGTRYFVPELFKDELVDAELNMTKGGHLVKVISDATVYAALRKFDVSGIITTWGVQAVQTYDQFTKAVRDRKNARAKSDEGKTTREEKAAAWEKIKEPYNKAVRRMTLKMELLAEDILDAGSNKVIG